MDMFRLRTLVLIGIVGSFMGGVMGSVGVLTVSRPPKSEGILVIATEKAEVGTWAPWCKFNETKAYSGRLISSHCYNESSGEVKLTLKLDNATDQDRTTYTCGNGAIARNFSECNFTFYIEDTTVGAPEDKDGDLPGWTIVVITIFVIAAIVAIVIIVYIWRNRNSRLMKENHFDSECAQEKMFKE